MKSASSFTLVLVTAPSVTVARRLARAALERRLIACANILPGIESMFWWEDAIQSKKETLLILKTRKGHLARLERLILSLHPYDTPEILSLPLNGGTRRYLDWLDVETG